MLRTGYFESVDIQEERIDEERVNLLLKSKRAKQENLHLA